jgi:hypothetical protein
MECVSNVHSKQRAVIEFLLTENKSITNIHWCTTNVNGDMAVDKCTVSRWAKRSALSEQGQGNVSDFPRSVREGVILIDMLPRGQMINSDIYVETLKKRFQRVRPHKDVAKVLQHNNARSHTSLHTQEAITKLQ